MQILVESKEDSVTSEIYDINETPPKVSLRVKSSKSGVVASEQVTIGLNNQLSAIIEEIAYVSP